VALFCSVCRSGYLEDDVVHQAVTSQDLQPQAGTDLGDRVELRPHAPTCDREPTHLPRTTPRQAQKSPPVATFGPTLSETGVENWPLVEFSSTGGTSTAEGPSVDPCRSMKCSSKRQPSLSAGSQRHSPIMVARAAPSDAGTRRESSQRSKWSSQAEAAPFPWSLVLWGRLRHTLSDDLLGCRAAARSTGRGFGE
jgi:hypothetical protein